MFSIAFMAVSALTPEQLSGEIFKQIIQSQQNLAMYGITVLVGVALLIVGTSWITNFYISRRELRKAIDFIKSETFSKQEKEFVKLAENIKGEAKIIKKEVEDKIETRMLVMEAEKCRLFSLICQQSKQWDSAASWVARAIEYYAKCKEEHLLRTGVDVLSLCLKECKYIEDEKKTEIKKCFSFIPQILQPEKKEIEDRLNKLPKEIPKGTETK